MKGEETIPKTKKRDMENVEAWGCYDREETKEYRGEGQGECRSIPDAGPTKHQKEVMIEESEKEMKGGKGG